MHTFAAAIVHTIDSASDAFRTVKPDSKVITIEPSAADLSMEEAVKLFCTVFKRGEPVERRDGSLTLASPAEQRRIQLNSANAS